MSKTLYIFDFDDTLATSNAEVIIHHANGDSSRLNSGQFASYIPEDNDEFDFSEFEIYPPNGKLIPQTFKKLQDIISKSGYNDIVVLTARGAEGPVREFLVDSGISRGVNIIALGSSSPIEKGKYVAKRVKGSGYSKVHVYEDNIRNVNAIGMALKDTGIEFSHTLVMPESHVEINEGAIRKLIKEIMIKDNEKNEAAGFVLVRNFPEGQRVLSLRVGNKFDLPKGHIENKETHFEAAVRETYEEAGINEISFPWGIVHAKTGRATLFLGMTSQDPVISANPLTGIKEHEEALWLTWEQLLSKVKNYLVPGLKELYELSKL